MLRNSRPVSFDSTNKSSLLAIGILVALGVAQGKPKLERLEQRLGCSREQIQGEVEDHTMAKDDRDILEILKDELDFIEQGGYGRSVRTPWVPKSIFQDSLSCLNYGYPYRAHPCADCRLIDFVGPQDHSQPVPCHFIPLDDAGKTIEELELEGNESLTITRSRNGCKVRLAKSKPNVTEHVLAKR